MDCRWKSASRNYAGLTGFIFLPLNPWTDLDMIRDVGSSIAYDLKL